MTDLVLQLDDFVFSNFEIPAKINGGGKQGIAIHQLIGGRRIVQAMGPIEDDITWTGRFQSTDAIDRVRALDVKRKRGIPVLLTYAQFQYQVVIDTFTWDFERFYQAPYSITCVVFQDLTFPVGADGSMSFDDAIGGDISDAIRGLTGLDLSSIGQSVTPILSSMNSAATLVGAVTSLVGGPRSTIAGALLSLQQAQGALTGAMNVVNGNLTSPTGLLGIVGGVNPSSAATGLLSAVNSFGQMSTMFSARGSVGRAIDNLAQL